MSLQPHRSPRRSNLGIKLAGLTALITILACGGGDINNLPEETVPNIVFYSSGPIGARQIFRMDQPSGRSRALTNDGADDYNPTTTNAINQVVFVSTKG